MKRITIIPLAAPKMMTVEARRRITECEKLYLQTDRHQCMSEAIAARRESANAGYITMDDLYDESENFDLLNDGIAARLVSSGSDDIGYVVLGRGVGNALMRSIRRAAQENGFSLELLASPGYADAALALAVSEGIIDGLTEHNIRSARSLTCADTSVTLAVEEVDTLLRAGEVKLTLCEYYPDEHEVMLVSMKDGCEGVNSSCFPLYKLDSTDNADKFDAATVLVVPPCGLTELTRHGFDGLMEVMYRLRAPGGCPWDAEQTHESLRSSLIEEAYEVLDAIDRRDMTALEEELGDLLLQIAFHAVIEQERSEFTMRDVTTGIVNKMIYRHPHVFGNVRVSSSDEVLYNWENLKKKEKGQLTTADAMAAIPAAFPALLRAYKIQKKASHVGFDWSSALNALEKVAEETEELRFAIASNDNDSISEEIGDLLFACVNVSRLLKLDPELMLIGATNKFISRFTKMEQLILSEGNSFCEMTLENMDTYWERVKNER